MMWLLFMPIAALSLVVGLLACGNSGKGAGPAAHTSSASSGASGASAGAGGTSAASGPSQSGAPTTVASNAGSSLGFKGDEDDDDSAANKTPGNRTGDTDIDYDNDLKDNIGKGYLESDDAEIIHIGRAASAAEEQAIASVAQGYNAAAVAGDGATACHLMYTVLEETVVEDYGSGAGPPYARGKTCSVVMSKLFQHARTMLTNGVRVTDVRVDGKMAYALMGSHTQPARYLRLHIELGAWKVDNLFAASLP